MKLFIIKVEETREEGKNIERLYIVTSVNEAKTKLTREHSFSNDDIDDLFEDGYVRSQIYYNYGNSGNDFVTAIICDSTTIKTDEVDELEID